MTRRTLDTGLLKNIMRHTDAHNKIQEQNEMWKQWDLKKQSHTRHRHWSEKPRGYMRSDQEFSSNAESLKWNKILLDYEETCKDRWGHAGYKELYPEEFEEQDDISNSINIESSKHTSNSDSEDKEKKRKKKKRKRKHKKEKVKITRNSDSSASDNESDGKPKQKKRTVKDGHSTDSRTDERKKKKRKRKKE